MEVMQVRERQEDINNLQGKLRVWEGEIQDRNRLLTERDQRIIELQAQVQAGSTSTAGPKGWEEGKFGDLITLGSDILFSSGRATLTKNGQAALSRLVGDLNGNYAGFPVRVYGYTDSDPIRKSKKFWADNLDLSSNRSMAALS